MTSERATRSNPTGVIREINGPIVTVTLPGVRNGEQVRIGKLGLVGMMVGVLTNPVGSSEGVGSNMRRRVLRAGPSHEAMMASPAAANACAGSLP